MATGLSSINPLQSELPPSGHPSLSPLVTATPPQSLLETEGIPLEYFIEQLDQQFVCVLCKKGLRWAMQAGCGCRSCYGCLQRYVKDQDGSLKCPNCGDEFSKDDIAKDSFARKKMEKGKMYCANRARGCEEQMLLKTLDVHLQQECNYELINCMHHSKGCLQRVQRNQLDQHLEKECAFRQQKCRYCGDDFVKNELELHEKECQKLLDECPNNCGEHLIHKNKIQDHLNHDCPLQVVTCLFKMFGCQFSEKRRDRKMDFHMGENQVNHLQLTTEHIIKTNKPEKDNMAKTVAKPTASARMQVQAKNEKQEKMTPLMKKIDNVEDSEPLTMTGVTASALCTAASSSRLTTLENKMGMPLLGTAIAERNLRFPVMETASHNGNTPIQETQTSCIGSNASAGESSTSELSAMSSRLTTLEKRMGMLTEGIAEHLTASYDGTLLWKIKDLARLKRDADVGKTLWLYSQPFYTSRYGYKMCARVYLNGHKTGKGTHVSLFFGVMRGDYDALLPWPFRQKVTLILLNQDTGRSPFSQSFQPDPASPNFDRPETERNNTTGFSHFVAQSVLSDLAYVKDDVMFIKVIVDANHVVRP